MTEPGDTAAAPAPEPQRPARPQYGEYATPKEVAAARGIPIDRSNEHVDRLAAPLTVAAPRKGSGAPKPPPGLSTPGLPLAGRAAAGSPLLTVLLLVFGIWNTVTSIPTFLDLGPALETGLTAAGYGTVPLGDAAHVVGILLLVFSFLVLIAAVGLSFQRIRARRRSLWVPLAAGGVWIVGLVVGMSVVVANTPGITALLQNHS